MSHTSHRAVPAPTSHCTASGRAGWSRAALTAFTVVLAGVAVAAGCGQDGEPTASTTTDRVTTTGDVPDTIIEDPDVTAASTVPGNSDKFPGVDPGPGPSEIPGGTFNQPEPGSGP